MNKMFGGCVSKMRESKILNNAYLGPFDHDHKLRIGDLQSMQFEIGEAGPFWLTPEQQVEQMNDRETAEDEEKEYSRSQLITKIKELTGIPRVSGNLKEIQTLAHQNNIPIAFV